MLIQESLLGLQFLSLHPRLFVLLNLIGRVGLELIIGELDFDWIAPATKASESLISLSLGHQLLERNTLTDRHHFLNGLLILLLFVLLLLLFLFLSIILGLFSCRILSTVFGLLLFLFQGVLLLLFLEQLLLKLCLFLGGVVH